MRFLRVREVIQRVGFSKATLYKKIRNGSFPKPVALGIYSVAFVEDEVVAWMTSVAQGRNQGSKPSRFTAATRVRK